MTLRACRRICVPGWRFPTGEVGGQPTVTFTRQDESDPRYARRVPVDEIKDPKNDYNLNLPRYIDNSEPGDLYFTPVSKSSFAGVRFSCPKPSLNSTFPEDEDYAAAPASFVNVRTTSRLIRASMVLASDVGGGM